MHPSYGTGFAAGAEVNDHASATSRHLEVERKFEVLDSTVTPSFDGVASIASVKRVRSQTLRAVYYDTPGQDLAAHHITLRRRTGGTDAGWHLKLPAGPVARTEIRTGFGNRGNSEVPARLRNVVLAIVRDRPVVPVARITTNRTIDVLSASDGTALAEFSDDHVSASADGQDTEQRWREWEVELAEDAIAGVAPMSSCWRGWAIGCAMPVRRPPSGRRNWHAYSARR